MGAYGLIRYAITLGPAGARRFTGWIVALAWLFCEKDLLIWPKSQQRLIDMMEKASGKTVAVTKVAGDHAPMFSVKEAVVEWVVGLTEP